MGYHREREVTIFSSNFKGLYQLYTCIWLSKVLGLCKFKCGQGHLVMYDKIFSKTKKNYSLVISNGYGGREIYPISPHLGKPRNKSKDCQYQKITF